MFFVITQSAVIENVAGKAFLAIMDRLARLIRRKPFPVKLMLQAIVKDFHV